MLACIQEFLVWELGDEILDFGQGFVLEQIPERNPFINDALDGASEEPAKECDRFFF